MSSHSSLQLTLLNEVDWKKKFGAKWAGLFGKKGPSHNIAGRQQLEQTIDRVMGELQTYLGMRDMDLNELTPQTMSKFLGSIGIGANPKDIPGNKNGLVDTKTVDAIVKDLSIKALTGEPMEYQKPKISATKDPFGLGNARRTVPTAVKSTATKTKTTQTGVSVTDYIKNWTQQVASVDSEQEKTALSKQLAKFIIDKSTTPGGAEEIAAALAPQLNTATSKPQTNDNTPTTSDTEPSMVDAPASVTPPAATSKPKTTRSAKPAEPAQKPVVMPAGTTPPAATTAKKPRKPRTKKQAESVNRLIDSVNRMQHNAHIRMTIPEYTQFTRILESADSTLKDVGLWRVLKESTDQAVVLRKR
jgi:hypothetical protein